MTVNILVKCLHCGSTEIVKAGFNRQDKQRYRCDNQECSQKYFILDYKSKGYLPAVKEKIIDMVLNGSGIRDTARVLGISTWLVMNEIKKSLYLKKSKLGKVAKER